MKQFLIMGNMNAITYKEVFPLIKDGKVWLGVRPIGTDTFFNAPKEYEKVLLETKKEGSGYKIINGEVCGRVSVIWYTNLYHTTQKEPFIPTATYDPQKYPKYDNYDAINVDKVKDIPKDYDGVMGVPITFLQHMNTGCYDVVGITENNPNLDYLHKEGCEKYDRHYVDGKRIYPRVLIKKKDEWEIVGLDRYVEGNKYPNKRMFIDGKEQYCRVLIKKKDEWEIVGIAVNPNPKINDIYIYARILIKRKT